MLHRLKFSNKLVFIICALSVFYCTPCAAQSYPAIPRNFLQLPDKSYEFNFIWQGDSVNGQWEPHAALLLPVKVQGCPKQFYMQFDLGMPSTVFYKSQLQQIHTKYHKTRQVPDTASRLVDYHFATGPMQVVAMEMRLLNYKSDAIDWANKKGVEIIGTIGADYIENRIVMLDYPGQKFYNGTRLPQNMASGVQLTACMFAGRTVLLPAVIKGKKSLLFFDTGSSAYELLTDKKTTELLAQTGAVPFVHPVRSWDKMLTATSVSTADSIEIAFQKIPIRHATYIEGVSETQVTQMMKMGIGGMTGNKLFIHSVLILDMKAKKFGVLIKQQ